MTKIRVVTDSTADLPQEIVDQYQIVVVPLDVIAAGKTYKDRVDIDNETFYQILRDTDELPTTSQPSPANFAQVYEGLAEAGAEEIISIHLASDLSGTYQSSVLAASMVEKQVHIYNIDSRTATIGLGLLVLSVARAVADGQTAEEAVATARDIIAKQNLFFLLDSLDNLHKGGRIGKASHLVGSLLNIKPVLSLQDGVISAYEKVRGHKEGRALERLIEILTEKIDPAKKVYCVVGYSDNLEVAQYMASKLKDHLAVDEYIYIQIGSVVSTHIGLGAVGLAFYQ